MSGGIRDKINQAPPWIAYTIVGVVVIAAVGYAALRIGGGSTKVAEAERHFYCLDCEEGFTASPAENRALVREGARARTAGPRMVRCPKCRRIRCISCRKCQKCGAYYPMPEKSTGPSLAWRDTCPKCGFSEQKDNLIRAAFQQKKDGTYDPNRLPDFMRQAVEEAEKSGKYDYLLK